MTRKVRKFLTQDRLGLRCVWVFTGRQERPLECIWVSDRNTQAPQTETDGALRCG